MNSIADIISKTDLLEIWKLRFSDDNYIPGQKIKAFSLQSIGFNNNINKYVPIAIEEEGSVISFNEKGSYKLYVSACYHSSWAIAYFYDVKGLTFFSTQYLSGFFDRLISKLTLGCGVYSDIGYQWSFVVEEGEVKAAYAYWGGCDISPTVVDLIKDTKISYEEYERLFYGKANQ